MKAVLTDGKTMRHYADSSQQRNGQAWFLPDESRLWVALICPAVKICRLGTHIAPKFAGRYYDSLAAACIFLPADKAYDPLRADERFFLMDATYCVGDFLPVGEYDRVHRISVGDGTMEFSAAQYEVDSKVSELSEFSTLKMGDLLIFVSDAIAVDLAENDRLEVTIDDSPSVILKIK